MSRYRFGEFEYDSQLRLLVGPTGRQQVRPQTARVLGAMIEKPNGVWHKKKLLEEHWQGYRFTTRRLPIV